MTHTLARAASAVSARHKAAMGTAAELAKAKFAGMTAARPATRDKRPIPTPTGSARRPWVVASRIPCESALRLPMTGQLGYLAADGLTLVEQTGLPAFADVMAMKPLQCRRAEATTFAWAKRDPAPAGGVGRVRALLLARCGMVEGREGAYPAAEAQLLVYGDDGHLEIVADAMRAATLDWRTEAEGPKLARAELIGLSPGDD